MPRDRKKVKAALLRKGFREYENDHSYFIYYTRKGKKTIVKTKVSHSGKDISKVIMGYMAKQCKISVQEFHQLVDCTLSQDAYEARLKAQALT